MAKTKIVDLSLGSLDDLDDVDPGDFLYVNDNSMAQTWTQTGKLMFTDEKGRDYSIDEIMDRIEAIEKRLAILPEPDAETLENHKMLREAYKKYKFLEGLVKENDDSG